MSVDGEEGVAVRARRRAASGLWPIAGGNGEGTACHEIGPELTRVDPRASVCPRLGSDPFSQLIPGNGLGQRRGRDSNPRRTK